MTTLPNANEVHADSRSLAASLAPVVRDACQGRLGEVMWFKTDWQRGGAATGKSTFQLEDGGAAPVVVKFPVVQRELLWTQRLQARSKQANGDCGVVPRLYACGETLGGYDFAWIVIECFPHGPLGLHWHDDHIPRMAQAAAEFHAAAAKFPIDQAPKVEPWDALMREATANVKVNLPSSKQRWLAAIKTARSKLHRLLEEWHGRDCRHWLHGDLHFANAMSRVAIDHGAVSLIDLAEVHTGHWVEDAVYLERQLWGRPNRLKDHKPVKAVAAARKQLGLTVESDYPRLAMVRRALLAGTAPKFIKSEGHPSYLEACLNWLEIALAELK